MSTHKKRSGRSPHKTRSTHKKFSSVRLMLTPEQLLEQGKLPEAIHLLQAELRRKPSNDPYRRLLGHCLFDTGQFTEAAQAWLALVEKQLEDVLNVGIAFLNAKEWDQAIEHLEQVREQQDNAQISYLLALAYVRDKCHLNQ
jgi:tetratricopeptide (TPR) repeat protein